MVAVVESNLRIEAGLLGDVASFSKITCPLVRSIRIIDGLAKDGDAEIWPNTLAIEATGIEGAPTAAETPQNIAKLASNEIRLSDFMR